MWLLLVILAVVLIWILIKGKDSEWAAERTRHATELVEAHLHHDNVTHNYDKHRHIEDARVQHEYDHQHAALTRAEAQKVRLDAEAAAANATLLEVHKQAQALQVDASTYATMRIAEHASKVKVDEQRELDKLALVRKEEEEKIRLDGYAKEVLIDLDGLIAARLIPHETVLGTKNRLQTAIKEIDAIRQMPVSPETMQRLLGVQEETIKGLHESLNEQISRYLLKARDGENVGRTDSEEDGQTHNQ